jgi:hypothetical protein
LSVVQTQEEIQVLEKECDDLAARLKTMMQFRKSPLSSRELQIKQDALTKEIHEAELNMAKLAGDLANKNKEAETIKSSFATEAKNIEQAKAELIKRARTTEENFRLEVENLKTTDAREEAELAQKIKALK